MRRVQVLQIEEAIAQLAIKANQSLTPDLHKRLQWAQEREESAVGREILGDLIENARLAQEKGLPICQDTGMAVVFLRIGQDLHIVGGDLTQAINRGVARGYAQGYLRASVVGDPLERINTGDNTPAVIHTEIVPGDQLQIILAPKGFGSENMSRLVMLRPADGLEGVRRVVLETVEAAGANPCPPMVLGVGLGGTMEKAALLAKQALLLPLDRPHEDPRIAALEEELLELVNSTGVGPQGLGGRVTALGVKVLTYPTHIAGLPVAVNVNCHVARHQEVTL